MSARGSPNSGSMAAGSSFRPPPFKPDNRGLVPGANISELSGWRQRRLPSTSRFTDCCHNCSCQKFAGAMVGWTRATAQHWRMRDQARPRDAADPACVKPYVRRGRNDASGRFLEAVALFRQFSCSLYGVCRLPLFGLYALAARVRHRGHERILLRNRSPLTLPVLAHCQR